MQINSNYSTDVVERKKKKTMRACWNTGATEGEEAKGPIGIDRFWRGKIYQFLDFKQDILKNHVNFIKS